MDILARARERIPTRQRRLSLPEGEDPRILDAAARLTLEHGVRCIVSGPVDATRAALAVRGLPPDDIEVVDPAVAPVDAAMVSAILALRPEMRPSIAERLLRKPLMQAGAAVATGRVDAMVAGAACPTARVIEAALMTIGLAPSVETPSSCFLMRTSAGTPDAGRTLLFADCAVNADPTPSQLADIGLASAHTWRSLTGEAPRIAFLSFSTHGSARHPRVERVSEAVRIARERAPDLAIDGELQADAAVSPRVAMLKLGAAAGAAGEVAGRADILVFPDLDSANIAYKLLQHLGGAEALGPFLQGFARPISDLSRGATVDDIVRTALVTLARL